MDAVKEVLTNPEKNMDLMEAFGSRLRGQFTVNESYRRAKELEWIESLRQYKGLYDPDVKIEASNSKVYPKITRSKVNVVLSRLHEMLFPDTDKNWEIEPTPEPKIAKNVVKQIALSLTQVGEDGKVVLPSVDDLKMGISDFCKITCSKMSSEIDDQLTEMNYPEETKRVLRSGLMYGTGVLKGPMIKGRTKRIWEPKGDGDYEEAVRNEDVPFYQFVRIWDFYPDMTTEDIEKADGFFERHVMTKHDLRQLLKREDFFSDEIREYMNNHPNGDYVPKNWEVDLQVIEVEAGAGREGYKVTSSSAAKDDIGRATNRQMGNKYELLEFWGYVDGSDLAACGLSVDDPTIEYGANVWVLGGTPIKVTLFDDALKMYKVFYYEKDETSIFGEGLPRIMRHSQIAISAGARMVLDNAACVSGPQVEINVDLLIPGTDYNSFYPRKIWYRMGKGIDSQYPAIRSLQFESHIPELLSIIDAFKQFGDEETTLPTWMIGQMMNNETAQATSGRYSMITISIKDVVKNFDTFTEGVIRDLYAWNMEFNPRQDIKGDYGVKPRGVSSLVMKEIRMQALNQLQSTMAPEDWDYVDRGEFLRERLKAHDINIKLHSEEQVAKIREERDNSKAQQLAYAELEAEIAYKKAQTLAQLTKAKEKNVIATRTAATPPENPNAAEDPRIQDAELAKKQVEIDAKTQEMAQSAERHNRDIREADAMGEEDRLQRRIKVLQDERKSRQDVELRQKKAEHDMKMKEKAISRKTKSGASGAKKTNG